MIISAFGLTSVAAVLNWVPVSAALLTLLALPLAVHEIRSVRSKDGPDLNIHLGGAARLELIFGVLFSVGFFL